MKKVREGYKKTLAGEIPEEWGYEELNKLVDKITDGTHKTPTYTESGIPFLRVTDIQKSEIDWNNVKYISQEEHLELIKRCNPEIGDILYSKNGTIGIPKIIDWDNEFSIFVSLCLIKMKKQESYISNKYLEQFLKSDSCMRQIRLRAKQGTVTNLHLEEIRELIIPIPTIKEQEKIASILSTVDEQIDNVDALIEKNKELKKGLMQTLLTKGIGHTKFKKTEIGEIPDEWEVINAGRVFDIITDYVANGSFASLAANVEYKESEDFAIVVRLTDYKNEYKGPFVYVDKKAYDFLSKSKLEGDDIIIANVGAYAGYVFRAPNINKPITLGPNAILVRSEQNREFIYYWLSSEFGQKAIKEIISTTAQPKFNKTDFKKILLPIPNLKEQYKISSILLKTDERIEEHEKEKKKLEQLKKGLMQQLLTGRIRVV